MHRYVSSVYVYKEKRPLGTGLTIYALADEDDPFTPNYSFKISLHLSHDIAVIQWITSCHKSRMTIRVITLWRVHVAPLTTSVSTMRFRIEIMFILKAINLKPISKGHTINRILHSWSFHMKCMNR